jgi:hypothetical protein
MTDAQRTTIKELAIRYACEMSRHSLCIYVYGHGALISQESIKGVEAAKAELDRYLDAL